MPEVRSVSDSAGTTTNDEVQTAAGLLCERIRALRRDVAMTGFVNAAVSEAGWEINPGPRVISGHESFSCRYGWLPKLYEAVTGDPRVFFSDEPGDSATGDRAKPWLSHCVSGERHSA